MRSCIRRWTSSYIASVAASIDKTSRRSVSAFPEYSSGAWTELRLNIWVSAYKTLFLRGVDAYIMLTLHEKSRSVPFGANMTVFTNRCISRCHTINELLKAWVHADYSHQSKTYTPTISWTNCKSKSKPTSRLGFSLSAKTWTWTTLITYSTPSSSSSSATYCISLCFGLYFCVTFLLTSNDNKERILGW